MPFDMLHIDRFFDAGQMDDIPGVTPRFWKIDDPTQVAFEMSVIDRVKADQRREQPDIRLRQKISAQIAGLFEAIFQPVKGVEQGTNGFFVSVLRCGEAGTVNAIINRLIGRSAHRSPAAAHLDKNHRAWLPDHQMRCPASLRFPRICRSR